MDNINYFIDLFESLPDYRNIAFLMFLIKNDVYLFQENGFLKTDINCLGSELKNDLMEQNEDYLDYINDHEESINERILENKRNNILLQCLTLSDMKDR